MDAPILFLVFNRPQATQAVFEAIRQARPRKLYLAADGPRGNKPGETHLCTAVRQIVSNVDWPCDVQTLFRSSNVGCRRAVSGAITWFFEHEEAGIILEDDCLPSQQFFEFCEFALDRWKDDEKVMHVGGHIVRERSCSEAMGFSHLVPIWGWATWRRAWSKYDDEMSMLGRLDALPLRSWYRSQARNVYRAIRHIHDHNVDAWGARWVLTVLANEAMSVLPKTNMISNIGFGRDATHTKSKSHLEAMKTRDLPQDFIMSRIAPADPIYDEKYLSEMNRNTFILTRIINRLRAVIAIE